MILHTPFSPHPLNVRRFHAGGSGNMGDVQKDDDPVRFGLAVPFVLVYIKGRFSGGTGNADVTIRLANHDAFGRIQSVRDGLYDFVEKVFTGRGATGGEDFIDWRVPADEYSRYAYVAGDKLVPVWTNPSTTTWSIEFGLAEIR